MVDLQTWTARLSQVIRPVRIYYRNTRSDPQNPQFLLDEEPQQPLVVTVPKARGDGQLSVRGVRITPALSD
jgi:hypothetical protein